MVYTRLKGGGSSCRIVLASNTSFSLLGELGLSEGILNNIASLNADANFSGSQKKSKIFEVKFIDV